MLENEIDLESHGKNPLATASNLAASVSNIELQDTC